VKVLFDHPNPFQLAHGGFQIQIEQTKLGLEQIGCNVEWLRWWDGGQKGDLIHYFGRAHPSYIRQCQEKKIALVMQELLTGLGSRPRGVRWIQRCLMRAAKGILPPEFVSRLSWESYRLADALIANSAWEQRLMIRMFRSPSEKTYLVPNGVEEDFFLLPGENPQRGRHLLCTATITPRKRILELCLAAEIAQVPLHVFGAPYFEGDPYFQDFLKIVGKPGSCVKYMGACVERKKLAAAYKKAAGFVLLSTMETRSLSAEEAAAAGCPLLLADLSWARSVFGATANYCKQGGAVSVAKCLKDFYERLSLLPRPKPPLRWHEVAVQMRDIYRQAISSR